MRTILFSVIVLIISLSGFSQDEGWPRTRTSGESTIILYQPQVDEWDNFTTLTFREAFSLTPAKGQSEVVGVISIKATTDVFTDEHLVRIHNINVLHINFPSEDSTGSAGLAKIAESFIPDTITISLERVVACVPKKETTSSVPVKNDPPVIFISNKPAILLQVDGKAVQADVANTSLAFLINANWPVFLDKKNTAYYLFDEKEWLTSVTLDGAWMMTTTLPSEMIDLVKDTTWASLKKAIPPPKSSKKTAPPVFYSDKTAELILFDGQPAFSKIPGISLVYATNTESDVFMNSKDKNYYILLGGRWFRSVSLNGPWSYVSADLPADFSKIPYDSPAARVLASVPGTDEAKDAVLIAQIPTNITIDPKTAPENVRISYSGDPTFAPVEGTTMTYATNTPDKVICVSDLYYYLCYQGIWFVSLSPTGPWQTATTIPAVIYTIPPSYPVYNVTYVTQTVTADGYVTASYTSGYTGMYIANSSTTVVIVYGTGFYYPPVYYYPHYGYPVYYPYPPPYVYHAYYGYHYPTYYQAGYNPSTGTYARSATAYGPYGSATAAQAYNPYTGTCARGVSTTTPYGTNSYAQAYNPRTGTYGQTQQHSNSNGQWGSSTVSNSHGQSVTAGHATTANGTVAGASTSSGAKAVGASGQNGSGGAVKTSGGDVYAGKDGNVYQKTDAGWSQVNGSSSGQANKASTSAQAQGTQSANRSAAQTQDLNKQAQDRQRGNYQSQQFQGGNRGSGGYGGGASRGGGGMHR